MERRWDIVFIYSFWSKTRGTHEKETRVLAWSGSSTGFFFYWQLPYKASDRRFLVGKTERRGKGKQAFVR
jgi:hypothetical protein